MQTFFRTKLVKGYQSQNITSVSKNQCFSDIFFDVNIVLT